MRIAICALVAVVCAGCEGGMQKEKLTVNIVSDSYCELGEKWRWHIEDTRETIAQARRVNAKYDRTCRKRSANS